LNSNRKFLFALIVLGIITAGLCVEAHLTVNFPGDLRLETAFQSINNNVLTDVFKFLSWLFGDWHAALLVFPAGLLVWWRFGRLPGFAVWASGLISLINDVLKAIVSRPRPSPALVKVMIDETGYSFPSGHVFFSVIFVGFLAYLLFTHLTNRAARAVSVVLLSLLILAVSASRVYLGVHWPSDVIGGYAAGGFFLVLLIWGYRKTKANG
jgi:undecaprenyl-diphosphatase